MRRADPGEGRPRRHGRSTGAGGFSLVELLVSLAIVVGLIVVVLGLFALSARVAQTQLHTSDMQQSVRAGQTELVRLVRMTGRGPLPLVRFSDVLLPDGVSVGVANNVPSNTRLGACDCANVLAGTDVLTLRGVFSSPVYQISPVGGDLELSLPSTGRLTLRDPSPTGVPQDLQAVKRAIEAAQGGSPEALLLVSPLEDSLYSIVEILPTSTVDPPTGQPEVATIEFRIEGGTHTADYQRLSAEGSFPDSMRTVAYAGLVEEYRFYVREERAIPGDPASELIPRLARAQFYPGTEVPYDNDTAYLWVDIADNIFDLQVALGIDSDRDATVEVGAAPAADDEWLFNHAGDDPTAVDAWNGTEIGPANLFYVRVTTLARTDRPDRGYQAELLTAIEDRDYTQMPSARFNSPMMRQYRRRLLETVIDVRNSS